MRFRPWGLGISGRDAWDPAERRWKGPSLLGENDGPTRLGDILPSGIEPDEILEWSGQPEGTYLDLKDRIVETQRYDLDGPQNVMMTAGANHANFVTMLTLIEPGDEVIAAAPSWPQFYILAEGFGAHVKMMNLEEEANWHWDPDRLNEMVSRKTKLICICNPNNPTGSRLTEKEVQAISDIAKSVGARILVDESFRWFEWDEQLTPTWVNYYDKAVVATGVSKMFSGDGLRIGWIASQDKQLVSECDAVRKHSLEFVNFFGAKIVRAALEPEKFKALIRKKWQNGNERLQLTKEMMKDTSLLHWKPPEASFLSFPGYEFPARSEDLCTFLKKEYQVILGPGIAYDKEYHVRFGFGRAPIDLLREGLENLLRFLRDYKEGRVKIPASTEEHWRTVRTG